MKILCLCFCLITGIATASARNDTPPPTKYDSQFGRAWQTALKTHHPRRYLEGTIRTATPPTPDQLQQLRAAGFKYRSVIDTILTGKIQARHVECLLKLPFVVAVEGGGLGGPKRTQGIK